MKRIITLALAAGLVVAATAPVAKAADLEVSGYTVVTGQYFDDMNFTEAGANGLNFAQRTEINMNAIVSEDLWGQIRVRMPATATWGTDPTDVGGGNVDVNLRHAFIDFTLPMAPVSIRAGLQPIAFPAYLGSVNPVLDSRAPAVVVSAELGMLNPTVAYVRAYDSSDSVFVDSTERDVFAVMVPVDMDMFSVTPWAAFADDINTANHNAYWLGATSKINVIEGVDLGVDVLYSSVIKPGAEDNTSGFLFDAYASYSLDFATVGGFFWYATGANRDGKGNVNDNSITELNGTWGPNTLWFDNGPSCWTGWGYVPSTTPGDDPSLTSNPVGTMAVGATISDVSVVDSLSMGAHLVYLMSTNDTGTTKRGIASDDWSALEIGANAAYDIYDDLTASVNVFYAIPMDIMAGESSAFTGGLSLRYNF